MTQIKFDAWLERKRIKQEQHLRNNNKTTRSSQKSTESNDNNPLLEGNNDTDDDNTANDEVIPNQIIQLVDNEYTRTGKIIHWTRERRPFINSRD